MRKVNERHKDEAQMWPRHVSWNQMRALQHDDEQQQQQFQENKSNLKRITRRSFWGFVDYIEFELEINV